MAQSGLDIDYRATTSEALQAEGEQLSPLDVRSELQLAYQALARAIPEDMRAIYLDHPPVVVPSAQETGLMTIEFDELDLKNLT